MKMQWHPVGRRLNNPDEGARGRGSRGSVVVVEAYCGVCVSFLRKVQSWHVGVVM